MKLKLHGTATYRQETTIGPAQWPHHDLFLVKTGKLQLTTREGTLGLCADDAIWIPPHVRFSAVSQTRSATIWVTHFSSPNLDPSRLSIRKRQGVWYFPGGASSELARGLIERLGELYIGNCLWQEAAPAYHAALLQELAANAQKALTPAEYSLDTLASWARANLSKQIGVRDLAERTGLSEAGFRAMFKKQTRQSPGGYLLQLRMAEARRLLLESELQIQEISAATGYSQLAAFNHAFLKFFQVSPGAYRALRRQGIS